jgi:glyoxylase-like metal-dependent hydrolase (beta-lactamase superfamily II)
MPSEINRRSFLRTTFALGAAASLAPRVFLAQAVTQPVDRVAAAREGARNTPIKITKLYDNVYLLQGAGGNMVAQSGADGDLQIDSSFATAVPHIKEALASLSKDAPDLLINTHWHFDHTDGNAGLRDAGFRILAHQKTRERLSTPQVVKMLGMSLPAAPGAALPTITFDRTMHLYHNGDSLDLVHFEPAHTDTDIYIHFHKADVLHLGDTWFNGFYPFIDESSGGSIGGMIRANQRALEIATETTKIIPGHGPLGDKAGLRKFHDMLSDIRDKVAQLKSSGLNEADAVAKKPTASYDEQWGHGMLTPDQFAGLVYRTI